MVYVPLAQVPDGITTLAARVAPLIWIVRTRTEPHALSSVMQNVLRQASGGLPVASSSIRSMDEIVSQSTARQGFDMLLLTIFGSSALGLAAIGIYGLMAYSVQQRTQEIAIRIALGAGASHVRNMVLFEGMRLAAAGIAIGIAAAFALTRLLAGFLFGVNPRDPLVFAAVPLLLSAVALSAVWLPARRATRTDPARALREA
jgi:ABC-type antimicrobial peptide transport system permease subunit